LKISAKVLVSPHKFPSENSPKKTKTLKSVMIERTGELIAKGLPITAERLPANQLRFVSANLPSSF
jgi:hypothetical protein|tara:strand:- start:4959 stop:5156 length:198 start_codon:yes stop_codon:yes gene_type:complete